MTDSVFFNNKEDLKFYDNFFVLPKELSQLSTISKTQSNFCVLVSGNAGCGKTTLLRILAKELDTTGIKCCFLRGSDFEFHFRIANYEETDIHNAVFFIDGLDEAKNPEFSINSANYKRLSLPLDNHIIIFSSRILFISALLPKSNVPN